MSEIRCQNCNSISKEGMLFCYNCGANLTSKEQVPDLLENHDEGEKQIESGEAISEDTTSALIKMNQNSSSYIGKVGTDTVNDQGVSKKKKWFSLLAGAVGIVVIAISLFFLFGKKAPSNYMLYRKGKELHLEFISKKKSFEMTDQLMNLNDDDFFAFYGLSEYIFTDESNRYIYYPAKADGNSVTYYWRDLKGDNSKETDGIKIDSAIYLESNYTSIPPYLTSDGKMFFYIKGSERRLYVYDRVSDEKYKLDDEVYIFYVNDSGDYLIYSKYEDGQYSIYEMSMKDFEGESQKIASDCYIDFVDANRKLVFYTKDNVLYRKEYDKDKEKLASDVFALVSVVNGESAYYIKNEKTTETLSNYVNDNMITEDLGVVEPVEPSYPSEPEYPDQEDYSVDVWYDSYYWGEEYNEETGEWGYWYQETDYEAYDIAVEQYWEENNAWYEQCNIMREEYDEAYEAYYQVKLRNDLRSMLASDENAVTIDNYSLYYWNGQTEMRVAENISATSYQDFLAVSSQTPVVIYQKYVTSEAEKQDISDLLQEQDYYYDIIWDLQENMHKSRNIGQEVFLASKGTENLLDCNNANNWKITEEGTVYLLNDYHSESGYGNLMSVSISGETVSDLKSIDEDVEFYLLNNINQKVYYYKNLKNGSGDLYHNGNKLVSDVYMSDFYVNEDDSLLYFTDMSDGCATLCQLKDGEKIKISDDVKSFVVNGKDIVYLADYNYKKNKGDMMLYNGSKKSVLLDSDVTELLSGTGTFLGEVSILW